MTEPTNQAEHLIQIWARKKYGATHQNGDTYSLELDSVYIEGSGCPTCGDQGGNYPVVYVHRHRDTTHTRAGTNHKLTFRGKTTIDDIRDVYISTLLNEMLMPLEPLK